MKTYTDARKATREVVERERDVLDIVGVSKNDDRCTFGSKPFAAVGDEAYFTACEATLSLSIH